MVENLYCDECESVPWLAKANGSVVIRCQCDDCLAIDSSEEPMHLPDQWAQSLEGAAEE